MVTWEQPLTLHGMTSEKTGITLSKNAVMTEDPHEEWGGGELTGNTEFCRYEVAVTLYSSI
jgi:hypothetical protein